MKVFMGEVADAADSYFKGMALSQTRDDLDQQCHDRPRDATAYA
jgi:hypothetical protein